MLAAATATSATGLSARAVRQRKLWSMSPSLAAGERTNATDVSGRPIVDVVNDNERRRSVRPPGLFSHCRAHWLDPTSELELWDDNAPTAQIEIHAPDFAPNYMHTHGIEIVSRQLREAMALGPQSVTWRPVELVRPSPIARSRDYRQMRLRRVLDAVDPARADFNTYKVNCYGGAPSKPPFTFELRMAKSIYWRDDFKPDHDLFRARYTNINVATDRLATRVLKAGITDVAFYDQQRMSEYLERHGRPGPLFEKRL